MQPKPLALATIEVKGAPRRSKRQAPDVGRARYRRFAGATPEVIASVLRDLESGGTEGWAELAAHMIRSDSHLRGLVKTKETAITSRPFEVIAHNETPAAEAAAKFCREQLENCYGLEGIFADILDAENVGWSVMAHDWQRVGGQWRSVPIAVEPRDVTFSPDWRVLVRSYSGASHEDLDTSEDRSQWIIHTHKANGLPPHLSGDLLPIAWAFTFKRWVELFWNTGAERQGNGVMIGKVLANAPSDAREAMREALENLSADHVGVIEEGTEIEILSAISNGEVWEKLTRYWNDQMSKAVLGSTLNVEVGATGGNRSLGESQFTTTILPRWESSARRLAGVVERDWLAPALRFNAHLFGGAVPPTPKLRFQFTENGATENPPPWELLAGAGALRVDELRAARGLEAFGPDKGGDRLVPPPEPVAPSFSATPPHEETAHPLPRAARRTSRAPREQLPLPMTTRPTSPTFGSSPTQIARVPVSESGDRDDS